ncbi:hypothetical protein BDF19DRAFT_442530 [Syncephalis fuscata]|nr:hypothetical protein BDF19DRAFT_442530 [Syncephalis fuscata]
MCLSLSLLICSQNITHCTPSNDVMLLQCAQIIANKWHFFYSQGLHSCQGDIKDN